MSHTLRGSAVLLSALILAGAGERREPVESWPEFRGPTGQGLSTAKEVPLRWGRQQNVVWTRAIPGKGWSSPIVQAGKVYLTTAVPRSRKGDAGPQSLQALALDARTGKPLWTREVFRQGKARIHSKNSHASPTPLTDGEYLYVHFGTNGTACLDLKGKVIWRNTKLRYKPAHGNGGSPALVGDSLVVNCDGSDVQFVASLNRRTGKIRWKKNRGLRPKKGFSFSTPLGIEVDGEQQVISSGSGGVISYDPHDGRQIWKVRYGDGYSVVPGPVHGQGLVFVCTGFDRPSLLAIRPDGHGDVTETHVVWRTDRGVPHNPVPLVVDTELYFVSDKGVASCLDARTGKPIWQERVLRGNFSASPVYADGRIYFQSEGGEGIVVEASKEFRLLARNSLEERSLASYAVLDGALFIRTQKHLYRLGDED